MSDPNPSHNESNPRSGMIGQAARAVAAYCELPDPRPQGVGARVGRWFASWLRSGNYLSEEKCTAREINGTAALYHVPAPAKGTPDYQHILRHAQELATVDAGMCKVRDFHDTQDEPKPYFGYRGKDGKCHVTQNETEAINARKQFKQTR